MKFLSLCLAGTLGLSACGNGSPHANLRAAVGTVTDAANSGSSVRLQAAAGDLLAEISRETGDGRLTATQADALRRIVQRLQGHAGLLGSGSRPPTITPATASPSVPPTPTPPGKKNKGHGDGKGNGSSSGSGEGDQGSPGVLPTIVIGPTAGASPSDSASAAPSPS